MSELPHSNPASANLVQPGAQIGAEVVDFQSTLHQETVILSPYASLCPPEQIGMASTLQTGHKTRILDVLSLPAELNRNISAAVIKISGYDGQPDTFCLGGISLDEHSQPRLNDKFILLDRDKPLVLGPGTRGGEGDDTKLWPEGQGYGQLTSSKHIRIAVSEQGVEITDSSTNGSQLLSHTGASVETKPASAIEVKATGSELSAAETAAQAEQPLIVEEIPAHVAVEAAAAEAEQKLEAVEAARDSIEAALAPAQTPEPIIEAANAEADSPLNQNRAMQDLQERWGLPEDATLQTAMHRLDATFEVLHNLQAQLGPQSNLGSLLPEFKQRLYNSLSEGRVSFNIYHVQSIAEQLQVVTSTSQRALHDRDTILTAQSRQQLDASTRTLQMTLHTIDAVMPQPGFMETGAVESAWRLLSSDEIEHFPDVIGQTMLEIERMRQDLVGYGAATESLKKGGAPEFVNDRIAELAVQLRGESVSEADVERAVNIMERHIGDDIDAKISGVTYPSRIVSNQEHKRKGGALKNQKAPSRQVAAEMAADMIRGKFDMAMAPGDIFIGNDGTVEDGQHRAAALISLYGKNWINKANELGFKVNKRKQI